MSSDKSLISARLYTAFSQVGQTVTFRASMSDTLSMRNNREVVEPRMRLDLQCTVETKDPARISLTYPLTSPQPTVIYPAASALILAR